MDSSTAFLLISGYKSLPIGFLGVLSLALLSTVSHSLGDVCQTYCGAILVQYPFGIGDGCGRLGYSLACVQNMLQLQLSSYAYQIHDIDYVNRTIILKDFGELVSCTYLRNLDVTGTYLLKLDKFLVCRDSNLGSITSEIPYLCRSRLFVNSSCATDSFYGCNSSDSIQCCATAISETSGPNFTCGVYGQAFIMSFPNMASAAPSASGLQHSGELFLELEYVAPPDQAYCTDCLKSRGSCGYGSSSSFLCLCGSTNSSTKCPDCMGASCSKTRNHTSLIIGLCVGGAIILIMGFLGVLLLFLRRARIGNHENVTGFNWSSEKDKELIQNLNFKKITLFSYRELEIATNSFSETRKLGAGGFGTVYMGNLRDGQIVAVKKLNQYSKYGLTQFCNEVTILSRVRHRNLVQLHGCCLEGRELLLVYEFVPNGTLADHLHRHRGRGLNWTTRLRIAVETSRALAYLHESVCPPILHRDVKPTNILLDESFHTKVADFGLSRFVPLEVTHISTAPQGTLGYVDPEYYESYQLTDKSDVYSFGVVLMEMISAKRAVDMSRETEDINLASFAIAKIQCGAFHDVVDPNLEIQSKPEVRETVTSVAELALCCLSPKKDHRPGMKEVAEKLEQILQQGYGASYESEPQEDTVGAVKEMA